MKSGEEPKKTTPATTAGRTRGGGERPGTTPDYVGQHKKRYGLRGYGGKTGGGRPDEPHPSNKKKKGEKCARLPKRGTPVLLAVEEGKVGRSSAEEKAPLARPPKPWEKSKKRKGLGGELDPCRGRKKPRDETKILQPSSLQKKKKKPRAEMEGEKKKNKSRPKRSAILKWKKRTLEAKRTSP